jgi:outer membrane lipoprotein-sorting protein
MKLCLIWLLIVLNPALSLSAESQPVDVKKIVKKTDELYRSKSSYAEIEMQIVTPNWERTLTMEAWTKGMDKTFIRINSPKKEKGMATLRIGNEMWNYLPKVNKVMKIPPSMMMSSWMGSDFTNDDLVHEFSLLEDYHYELMDPEDAKDDLYYVKLIPREGLPIVWGHIVFATGKSDYIPVWQKFYDEKGKLMRLMNFKDVKPFDGREIPSVMEMIPLNKEGHKTVIRYLDAEFDSDIGDDTFTLRNLRRAR